MADKFFKRIPKRVRENIPAAAAKNVPMDNEKGECLGRIQAFARFDQQKAYKRL